MRGGIPGSEISNLRNLAPCAGAADGSALAASAAALVPRKWRRVRAPRNNAVMACLHPSGRRSTRVPAPGRGSAIVDYLGVASPILGSPLSEHRDSYWL